MSDWIIDRSSPVPMYYQLKKYILDDINNNSFSVGDALPTESEIEKVVGISRTPIRQTLKELEAEGYIERFKGKGTFVKASGGIELRNFRRFNMASNLSFNERVRLNNQIPSTKLITLDNISASASVAASLDIDEGDNCYYIRRVRFSDYVPVVVVDDYVKPIDSRLLSVDYNTVGLFESIAQFHPENRIVKTHQYISAVLASAEINEYLQIPNTQPCQFLESRHQDSSGSTIVYARAYYRGDESVFEIETPISQ